MRIKTSLLFLLTVAATGLFVVACGAAATTPIPTPTPESQAIISTPVPPEARETALEFTRDYRAIEEGWEQFHTDFDTWRVGLVSCDRSSMQMALRDFAGDFNEITVQARNLPRPPVARELADGLIAAAEKEGAALRQLRDNWQPENTALFEAVDMARSGAANAQKVALDRLNDLQGSAPTGSQEAVRQFSAAFEQVNQDWGRFHDNYTSLRQQQADLSSTQVNDRLTQLVTEFSSISSAVNSLPSSGATEDMADRLKAAAEAEDMADRLKAAAEAEEQALRDLSNSLQSTEPTSTGTPEPTPAGTPAPTPTGSPESTPVPADEADTSGSSTSTDLFTAMDSLVESNNATREQVEGDLQGILGDAPADSAANLDDFRQQYNLLVREWDRFHQAYDEWRRTEGGCNRTEVIDRLGQFSVRFGELSGRVQDLPQASFTRPMEDLLVEAAQREEEALRVLRNTWRPFTTDVYRALDQERANAETLRRQAEVGVQELLERFNISPSEV
jgi:hypothetical protein